MANPDLLAALLQSALAEELRHVRKLIEQLAELLVCDEHFAANYVDQLQAFDLLAQHTDESAAVLDRLAAGFGSHDAVAPVRLSAIQTRLRAALDQGA
jgi:hypothetical protein